MNQSKMRGSMHLGHFASTRVSSLRRADWFNGRVERCAVGHAPGKVFTMLSGCCLWCALGRGRCECGYGGRNRGVKLLGKGAAIP